MMPPPLRMRLWHLSVRCPDEGCKAVRVPLSCGHNEHAYEDEDMTRLTHCDDCQREDNRAHALAAGQVPL